jgi:hypothetical protein
VNIETIYSSASEVAENVRGLDSVRTTFGVVIKDVFQNQTDTLFMTLKPYFEERVPPSGFKPLPLSSQFALFTRSGPQYFGMENAWDGITGVFYNWFYIRTGNLIMPYFTLDMGAKTKISRIRLWQRSDFLYALHNPKSFEVYGTNDIAVASDAETENWVENPSWIKLGQFNSYKPSGESSGVTGEDEAYAIDGEDYDFPLDAPHVRYLRFKILEVWGGSTGFHIEEMAVWGEMINQ